MKTRTLLQLASATRNWRRPRDLSRTRRRACPLLESWAKRGQVAALAIPARARAEPRARAPESATLTRRRSPAGPDRCRRIRPRRRIDAAFRPMTLAWSCGPELLGPPARIAPSAKEEGISDIAARRASAASA